MGHCLFCLKATSLSLIPPPGGIEGASNCDHLGKQLLRHFILRKLLDIPRLWYEDTLRKFNEASGADDGFEIDNLKLCRGCMNKVHLAWKLYQEFVKVEASLNAIKDEVKQAMRQTTKKSEKKMIGSWERDIRSLLFPDEVSSGRDNYFVGVDPLEDTSFPFDESDPPLLENDFQSGNNSNNDNNDTDSDIFPGVNIQKGNDGELFVIVDVGTARIWNKRIAEKLKRKRQQEKLIANPKKRKYRKRDPSLIVTKKFYKCPQCSVRFKESEDFDYHMELHKESKENGFDCPICLCPNKSSHHLEIHKFNEHNEGMKKFSRPFACGKCEFTSPIWKMLRKHAAENHPGIPDDELGPDAQLLCAPCGKFMDSANTLINHQKKMHPQLFGVSVEAIQCDQCNVLLPSQIHLQYHLKAEHKRINAFMCDTCGKGFTQRRRLDRHKVMHEKNRDFVCHLCGCNYLYKSSLTGHYRKFHPEYDYSSNSHLLARNLKPNPEGQSEEFGCKYCDLKFPFKISLIQHMSTHKKTMGVQCELCSKYYVNTQGLRQHMKLNHSTTNQETQCPHCLKVYPNPHSMHTHSVKHCKMRKLCDFAKSSESDPVKLPPEENQQKLEFIIGSTSNTIV